MAATVVSVDIDRPAGEVFAYVTDPSRFAEWQQGVVEGHLEATGRPSVGTICRMTRRIGWANRTSTSRLTRYEPPHRWAINGIDGPIRAQVEVTVQALSEARSRVTIGVEFAGHGVGALLVPLVIRRQARREMPTNMAVLRARLQSSDEPVSRRQGAGDRLRVRNPRQIRTSRMGRRP